MKKLLPLMAAVAAVASCSPGSDFRTADMAANAPVVLGPQPMINTTPAERLLECVAKHRNKNQDLRVGVGEIVDGTGARTLSDGSSTLLTQRPDMMVTVAMMKTGLRVLNRNSTKVSEWELSQALEQRLGEGKTVTVDAKDYPFRPVAAGSMLGSTHFVTGAITEVNWNINSGGTDVNIAGAFQSGKTFYISVAADLIVTDTVTTEVVLARSYTKQIVGREINRGLFRFVQMPENSALDPVELFDASIGEQRNEPVQKALRWLLEYAAYDIAATLSHTEKSCQSLIEPQFVEIPAPKTPVFVTPAGAPIPVTDEKKKTAPPA